MTVAVATARVSYAGSGTTGPFSVPFYFLDNSHLKVIKRSAAGVETTLTITTNYTVSGAGVAAGGTVTTVAAVASGETLVILRNVPRTQETDYPSNDRFPAASHEQVVDKLTMIDQQQQEEIDRALTLPDTETPSSTLTTLPIAADRASMYLAFDASGNPIASTGTGTDTGLRGDLASTSGSLGAQLVGYLAAGTGSVARTARSKMRDTVSVLDFGAAADGGVTDNRTPFINACAAAGAGGRVYIPAGDNFYGFSAGFSITQAGLTLEGDGDRSFLINMSTSSGNSLITVDGVMSVALRNFGFAGHASSGHGIRVINNAYGGITENLFCRNVGIDCFKCEAGWGWLHLKPRFTTNIYAGGAIGPFPYAGASALAERGIHCSGAGANSGSMDIISPRIEGMGVVGVILNENSTVVGGTIEGNYANIRLIGNQMKIYGTNGEAPDPGPSVYIDGNQNVVDGMLHGGTYADLHVAGGSDNRISNSTFNNITIDAAAKRTELTNVWYGQNSGGFTDNGENTRTTNLYNTSNENQRAADKKINSHVNFVRNGGFERWVSATSLDAAHAGGYSIVNGASITRVGDGEATTTKISGHYSCRINCTAAVDSGLEYQGPQPAYADLEGKALNISVRAKDAGGSTLAIQVVWSGGYVTGQSFTLNSTTKKCSATFPYKSGHTSYVIRFIGSANAAPIIDDFNATVGAASTYGNWDNLKEREIEPEGWHVLTTTATPTVYGDVATHQHMTLSADVTAITFANFIPGKPVYLHIKQAGAGGKTLPAAASWASGAAKFVAATAPSMTATADVTDILKVVYDGTSYWVTVDKQNLS